MKHLFLIFVFTLLMKITAMASPNSFATQQFELKPNGFIENKGQIKCSEHSDTKEIKYYATFSNTRVFFSIDKISIVTVTDSLTERTDLQFKGGNKFARISADGQNSEYFNYYLSKRKLEKIKSYGTLRYKDLYKNIDLVIYKNNNNLKYDFIVRPGANLKDIKFKYAGEIKSLKNSDNTLQILTPLNKITESIPEAYILDDNVRKTLDVKYKLKNGLISFDASKFNNKSTLIIDPELLWSTYLGGNSTDMAFRCKYDNDKNIIVTGNSTSIDFPSTPGVYCDKNLGNQDMFVSKFSPEGKLVWSTFVGGTGRDHSNFIGIGASNSIWCGGETSSYDLPDTPEAFQSSNAGGYADGSIIRLNANGLLEYVTYQGGEGYEAICDGDCDSKGDLWCVGGTFSSTITTTSNALKTQSSGMDALIVKVGNDLKLKYASLYGGTNDDTFYGVAINSNDEPVSSGNTLSNDYPTTSQAIQKNLAGGYDAVLTKFNINGQMIWSTFCGGGRNDFGGSITCDSKNNIIATGFTTSLDFKTTSGSFQHNLIGENDRYLLKMTDKGDLLWSTYFGGDQAEGYDTRDCQYGNVKCDKSDNIYLTGWTTSQYLYTTSDAFSKKLTGQKDVFFAEFNSSGDIVYSSYIGGKNNENGISMDCDNEDIILCGFTESLDFPVTTNAYQKSLKGGWDVFLMMFGNPTPCLNLPINFPDFTKYGLLKFNGSARKADSTIKLTDTRQYVVGSVWFDGLIPIDKGFSTKFSFRFTQGNNYNCQDGSLPGADGIAFLIQDAGVTAIGYPGGGLGYENIPNSLAIEYDTFSNDSTQIENFYDPNGNHVAVQSLGSLANTPKHTKSANIALNSGIFPIKSDGRVYYSQIDYNATNKTLTVYLDSNKTLTNRVIYVQNFEISKYVTLIGGTKAVLGFTSATGCATQNHEIMSWEVCVESAEPATAVLENSFVNNSQTIYPNPAETYFSVNAELLPTVKSIRIFDCMSSNVLKSFNLESVLSNKFDISNLSNGFYFIAVDTGDKVILAKLIILK